MRLLVLLALQLALVHGFSWDIVLGIEKRLEFYYNGTLTHTEDIPSAKEIKSTTYDPVHYRIIFADNNMPNVSISSFDLSTRKIQHLVTGTSTRESVPVAYDPVTQFLFWRAGFYNIHSFPLNLASSNKAVENIFVTTKHYCLDIAVDSCGGYIYWITDHEIERARFDGSEREILIEKYVYWRLSLEIDPQTQTMYWIELNSLQSGFQLSIVSANLNGKNGTTLYVFKNELYACSLSVSKDYIYCKYKDIIWQLHKNPCQREEPKLLSISHSPFCMYDCQHIAANYTTKEQTQGNLNCESLKSLIPNYSVSESTDESVHCSHGTEVSEESRYESTPGYTGERSELSICQNYCVQGDCSVSADGQPECRCKTGFSGERCEVNVCHKHCLNRGLCSMNKEDGPVCECTEGYNGERCEVSICKDYCLQGNCSVSTEGKPKCSCYDGYSGERCEVNACHNFCLNNGACSLNEEDESIYECTEGYEGKKCDVSICKDYLQGNCSVVTEGQPKCSCNFGFSGERCEYNACHEYCLNNGVCSLNEEDEPICECTEGYEGKKCDVSICKDYCLQGNCSVGTEGQPKCSCNFGFTGERCEFNACHEYCLNNGVCSLNEENEPVCQCTAGYDGERCDVPASVLKCI